MKGFQLQDNTINEYVKAVRLETNNPNFDLTSQQRKGINYSIRLINNTTSPQAREQILQAIDDYVELQDRIVGQFRKLHKLKQESYSPNHSLLLLD